MKKIALGLFAFIFIFGVIYVSNQAIPETTKIDVLGSFSSWKLYEGKSDIGFNLKYPTDWTVTFDENFPDYVDFTPSSGNGFAALIIPATNKKQTLSQWLKARDKENNEVMGGQYPVKIVSTKKVRVGKISAIQRVEYMTAAGFKLIHTYAKKGNNFYMFTLTIRDSSGEYTTVDKKIYDKILSTVQF